MSFLDSKRIVGTNADRVGTDAISGGWKELGRTTLGSGSSTITVSSLPDKRYYKVLTSITGQASNSDVSIRLNGDTGSNYARRFSTNGGSDIAGTVTSLPYHYTDVAKTTPIFAMAYLANKSDKEKLSISHGVRQTGTTAGAPSRFESVGKWANTSNGINEIQVLGSTNFNSGSECVVLGYDPDDTHTDNFWEQLADVSLSSASDTINSGTLSAKKYIWFQVYAKGANTELQFRFNSDSGSNYASRRSGDGGSDSTFTSQTMSKINATGGASHTACFMNGFVINNSANEKLVITNQVATEATGAGTAPRRSEGVTKWSNTSSQITSIQAINNSSGDFDSGSFIKVWGSN